MTLGVWIRKVWLAHLVDLVQQSLVKQNLAAQVCPVLPPTTRDDVVNGCEGEALVIEVAMDHVCLLAVRALMASGLLRMGV